MKKALITGVTGQDGAYLAEFLLARGYEVHGTSRNPSYERLARIRGFVIAEKVKVHTTDLGGIEDVSGLLRQVRPSEIYYSTAQSKYWKRFAATLRISVSIIPRVVKCSVAIAAIPVASTTSRVLEVLMQLGKQHLTGLLSTTAKTTVFTPVLRSYLTMNRRYVERIS
jgi:nucleoside-diphosphate-sugar epimerase